MSTPLVAPPGSAAAHLAAAQYLHDHRDAFDVTVQPVGGGFHRATIRGPHPAAPDLQLAAAATGSSRDGAVELARLELGHVASRTAEDPAAAARDANELREAHIYAPGMRGITRVRRAVHARGFEQPSEQEVAGAWLQLRMRHSDDQTMTVGEVADAVLERRTHPALRDTAREHVTSAQVALPV